MTEFRESMPNAQLSLNRFGCRLEVKQGFVLQTSQLIPLDSSRRLNLGTIMTPDAIIAANSAHPSLP